MEDSMCPTTMIEDLPYEILLDIFCYLTEYDLLESTQYVCHTWKTASHDSYVWRERVYTPTKVEDIRKFLERAPRLQCINLKDHLIQGDELSDITDCCQDLRKITFSPRHLMESETVEELCLKCPNLEELSITILSDLCGNVLSKIAGMVKLKKLDLYIREGCSTGMTLKPLADGCPSLIGIDFEVRDSLCHDLAYFLGKKGNQLQGVKLKCTMFDECVLPHLTMCKKLKELSIDCKCIKKVPVHVRVTLIQSMMTLKSLEITGTIGEFVLQLLKDCTMPQLVKFGIGYFKFNNAVFIDSLVKNCPFLNSVRLECVKPFNDDDVLKLSLLSNLETLALKHLSITDSAVDILATFKKLKYLNLTGCTRITRSGMGKFEVFQNLRHLVLDGCYVDGFPFYEVTSQLPKLTFLSMKGVFCTEKYGVYDLMAHMRNKRLRFLAYVF